MQVKSKQQKGSPVEQVLGAITRAVEKGPVAVAAGDLDGFKAINDTEGRDVGDAVLASVEAMLSKALPDATVVRTTGDLYFIVLSGMGPEAALLALETFRSKHLAKRLEAKGRKLAVSITFGIAAYPHHVEEPADLPAAAEEALHRAKATAHGTSAIYVEEKMVLKSNYYPRGQLARLSAVAKAVGRTEADILREALAASLERYRDVG